MIFCVSWLKTSCALSSSDPPEERGPKAAVPSMERDIIKFFCIGYCLAAQNNTGSVRNYFVLESRKTKTVKTVFAGKYCQEEKQEASLCFSDSNTSKKLVLSLWSSSSHLCTHAPERPQRAHQHNLLGGETGHRARTGAADWLRGSGTPPS